MQAGAGKYAHTPACVGAYTRFGARWCQEAWERTAAYGVLRAAGLGGFAAAAPPTMQGSWWSLNSLSIDILVYENVINFSQIIYAL